MFNAIIQPTGIYNSSQMKAQAQQKTSESFAQNTPNTVQENYASDKSSKKKMGIAAKSILLTFAAIGVVWSVPALKNMAVNKQKDLIIKETEIFRKKEELLKKGNDALQKETKALQKEMRIFERDKKIFEKINASPILSRAKKAFVKAANFIEKEIQKPIQNFFTKHVFSFVKK